MCDLMKLEGDDVRWEEIGAIGIDSGQMMLIDPCYTLPEDDYKLCVKETSNKDRCGIVRGETGGLSGFAVTKTFSGDGVYPVFVKRSSDGKIREMKIKFDV